MSERKASEELMDIANSENKSELFKSVNSIKEKSSIKLLFVLGMVMYVPDFVKASISIDTWSVGPEIEIWPSMYALP